jgi:hypothetical protein
LDVASVLQLHVTLAGEGKHGIVSGDG